MFFVLRIYFRRIHITGLDNLSYGKPVVLASSHSNSFNDAFVLGTMLDRSLNYLARSDVFKTALIRRIFKSFHMLPIYRIQEGKDNVIRNLDTFGKCFEILQNKGLVLIYAEGLCVQEKRMRPIKKGAARIAFGALENGVQDIHIVPVGLNYTYPAKFRGEVIISIGKPIKLQELTQLYQEHPAVAYKRLGIRIGKGMMKEMIIIDDPKSEPLAERLLLMVRNHLQTPFLKWRFTSRKPLETEQAVTNVVNSMKTEKEEEFNKLDKKTSDYFARLARFKLKDSNIAGQSVSWVQVVLCFMMLPIIFCGYIFRYPVMMTSEFITSRTVKSIEFYGSVFLSVGFIIYLLLLIATCIIFTLILGWLWGLILLFAIPLIGFVNIYWEEILLKIISLIRYKIFRKSHREETTQLKALRMSIIRDADLIPYTVKR